MPHAGKNMRRTHKTHKRSNKTLSKGKTARRTSVEIYRRSAGGNRGIMPKVPLLNAREVSSILIKLGFEPKRQEGRMPYAYQRFPVKPL
jgi:hypothetical protein